LGYSKKFTLLKNKNQKINIKADNMKKEDRGGFQKIYKNQAVNLKEF